MEDDYINTDLSNLISTSATDFVVDAGTLWLDTNSNNIYIHDGTSWSTVGSSSNIQLWINAFPEFDQVQEMCKEYPSLEKAYENFKTVYKMVEQDWVGKQKSDQGSLF